MATNNHAPKDKSNKPVRPQHSASKHPAKSARPLTPPSDRDGFRQDVGPGAQAQRVWLERDAPLSQRKDRG
jgi:hypothetical protein